MSSAASLLGQARMLPPPATLTAPSNNKYQGVGWVLAIMFFVDSVLVGTALQRMQVSVCSP